MLSLPPARRAEPQGRGAGGDVSLLVDTSAEAVVLAELEALGRPLTLISEELGERDLHGGGPPFVVLDPIDGSLNAKRGLPGFATALAVAAGRTIADVTLGLVRDHGTGEDFVAERGRGAWVDGAPLAAAPPPDGRLELLMLEGASPARVARAARELEGRVRRLRAMGSLALSLCHTAAGRADAMAGLAPRPRRGRGRRPARGARGRPAGGLPVPRGPPRDAARPDDPLPGAGRARPGDPRAAQPGAGTLSDCSVRLTVSPGLGPPRAW